MRVWQPDDYAGSAMSGHDILETESPTQNKSNWAVGSPVLILTVPCVQLEMLASFTMRLKREMSYFLVSHLKTCEM
jgi:hypothetical protein